jgi:para-aminobenzoate synthetase
MTRPRTNILLVDNYDSFTFNLYQLASQVFGPCVHVVRNDEEWDKISGFPWDAAIISPGPGRPDREADFGISRRVIAEMRIPILGVCLGCQGICHFFGGQIVHAAEPVHGRVSAVFHSGAGLFQEIPSPFQAVRYHSLAAADPLPDCLDRTAWTKEGIVMAVAHRSLPIFGVQFHPESIGSEFGRQLIPNFKTLVNANRRRVFVRESELKHTAEHLFETLFAARPYAFWLDSSLTDEEARFSFMGGYSDALRYRLKDRLDFWNALQSERIDAPELPFEFIGGFVGYFGYELNGSSTHTSPYPDAYLMKAERFLAIDHATKKMYLVSATNADPWFDEVDSALIQKRSRVVAVKEWSTSSFEPALSHSQYLAAIAECQTAINDGESYQICLTNQLTAKTNLPPFEYYKRLRQRNPAPYSAFLQFPELSVTCSSPERFLKIGVDGTVESKPMKGTAPRGLTESEDTALHDSLAQGEKNRAENLMIVDLLRNDLGKVCEIGSVKAPKLMQVESYATVHQLVSTITGHLRPDQTAIDCLRAAFPGGSMTGAPKIRTMEKINALEPRARGIYSGSIGFLSFNGAADLNIVIRTAVFSGQNVTIGVGGAIIALSDPQEEWEEIWLKSSALLDAFY